MQRRVSANDKPRFRSALARGYKEMPVKTLLKVLLGQILNFSAIKNIVVFVLNIILKLPAEAMASETVRLR